MVYQGSIIVVLSATNMILYFVSLLYRFTSEKYFICVQILHNKNPAVYNLTIL